MHRIFELACNKFIKERLKITFFFKYSRFGIGTKKGSRDKSIYLTKLMWTPRLRWAAEQSMQRKIPYVTEAHVGFLALQSKHIWNKRNEGKTMKSGERKYEIWRYRSRSAIFRTRSRRTKQFRAGEKGGRVPCFRTWIWAFWKWRSCRLRFRMPWPQNREGERERERDFSSSLFLSREEVRGVRPGIALVLWGRKTDDKGFNALSLPLCFALALSLLRSTKKISRSLRISSGLFFWLTHQTPATLRDLPILTTFGALCFGSQISEDSSAQILKSEETSHLTGQNP